MTTSTLPARYKINGLLDTKDPVFDNIEKICNACGTFMSYDIHEGKWAVIINKTETAVMTFDDSNIVGPIQVNGTSILNLYNSVRVEYPLRDTEDGIDFVTVEIPTEDRYQNEPDNVLQLRLDMCNEPVQAEIIGLIELKQARIDQIVTFQSDYSTLNLNAGDVIAVTNDLYQFNAKPFRVITLKEIDADDGSIRIEVTALAYDANVYDTSDLGRYIRSDRNGIKGIGSIGQPNEPTLTVYQQDVRPGIQVEAVVPSGIVEIMELWLSSDNTNFKLIGTEYPEGGTSFNPGDTVVFDYDQLDSQNIYVKVRGMNSTTTGPFSVADSFLSFVPVQTTSAITQDTGLIGDSGNLPLALGLATLLNKLTTLFGSGDASKTLGEQLIANENIQSSLGSMAWVTAGSAEYTDGPWPSGTSDIFPSADCLYSGDGLYVVATFNFGSDAAPSVDPDKVANFNIYQNGTLIDTRSTSSSYQDVYDDFALSGVIFGTFTAGDSITFEAEWTSVDANYLGIDFMIFQPMNSVAS